MERAIILKVLIFKYIFPNVKLINIISSDKLRTLSYLYIPLTFLFLTPKAGGFFAPIAIQSIIHQPTTKFLESTMKEDELGSEQERGNYLKRGNLSKIKEILLFPYSYSLNKDNSQHPFPLNQCDTSIRLFGNIPCLTDTKFYFRLRLVS